MELRLEVGLLTALLVYSFSQTPCTSKLSRTLQTPCYSAAVPMHVPEKSVLVSRAESTWSGVGRAGQRGVRKNCQK